ncbi:MAG TPA: TIGR03936 family radical SAM-associated protein [Acidimicrobiia bacterium]|nr:TIGR03936 family radical SAM-associated protein [Acidimicrobiia bacterium]
MRGEAGHPIRVRFSKLGKVRFVSHRDVARAVERAVRIEALPVAFTQGFSPRPKVSFGLALAVGYESRAEYLDLELRDAVDPERLPAALSAALPPGLDVTGATALAARAAALQEAVSHVGYEVHVADLAPAALTDATHAALAAETLPVPTTRKGRDVVVDLRPGLEHLDVVGEGPAAFLAVELSTRTRSARPAELLAALRSLAGVDAGDGEDRVLRTHQWIERDGARLEPLEADRAPLASAEAGPRALEACA